MNVFYLDVIDKIIYINTRYQLYRVSGKNGTL